MPINLDSIIYADYIDTAKVYVLCPVRNISDDVKEELDVAVEIMDEYAGEVHYPPRDTEQIDESGGFDICVSNISAIRDSDIIAIYWDPTSKGSYFDLGAVFEEYIRYRQGDRDPITIKLLNEDDLLETEGKSFEKVIKVLADATA